MTERSRQSARVLRARLLGASAVAVLAGTGAAMLLPSSAVALRGRAAKGCPSWARVTKFKGIAPELSFEQSASGSDAEGGTQTVSLDRQALVGFNVKRKFGYLYAGTTYGGTISVNDTWTDNNPSFVFTGSETASGPVSLASPVNAAYLFFSKAKCTYQLEVSFDALTQSTGTFPDQTGPPPDTRVSGVAYSPPTHIPANLKLSGSATLPAGYSLDCPSGNLPNVPGCYSVGGIAWRALLETVAGTPTGQAVGTAEFGWRPAPVYVKKKKTHPTGP